MRHAFDIRDEHTNPGSYIQSLYEKQYASTIVGERSLRGLHLSTNASVLSIPQAIAYHIGVNSLWALSQI